ncbi:MAG: DUF2723 domain-containing protein [Bacteroidales bacterium]|nr:DUF2723 domain-containing protein [Bacteroidales bacterium]
MNYKKVNTITGWISFAIASVVYLITLESTVSFWDCGEFISAAFKLEVGHPPGAPFFMILGRFFTLFAGENVENVSVAINALSALASAFTILFLFWTITHLLYKIIIRNESSISNSKVILIIGSAFVGAMAYTFSDTFWFSAVEGEVYATSSLFTAFVFWAILKWENESDKKFANRWLIFISYLIGISIGIHLLNLLAIPAIVFVYYFKKYKPSRKGIIGATLISIILLAVIMWGIIPGVIKVASLFELLFVNSFKLPYHSGLLFYIAAITGLLAWGIHYTHKKGKVILNTIILSLTVIIIGYSSYATIMIRSLAEPPMDQNNPDNLFSLLYYLNREQYGDRPLFKGKYYNAPLVDRKNTYPFYAKINGKYEIIDYSTDYKYDERFTTLFPRMFSEQTDHVEVYKKWGKIKGKPVRVSNYQGKQEIRQVPTFGENLRFFFSYQLGFMYFRYFMWNFSGRQNDIQGFGNVIHGNWISGIPFIDNPRLGDQSKLPSELAKNKSRNTYYMLPFLLGLIGIAYQFVKDKKSFTVIALLFVLTGIAIVVYLNQNPNQPRERDYAYAGSFYAYAIWIGMGVAGIASALKTKLSEGISASIAILLSFLFVPYLMAKENWDDHDRSGRYTARDFASNYLNSCAPNAILFTNGDNDTFPLWYVQEVEGIRTDIRVVNLSYLTADWYIEQLSRKAYEADPVPFSLTDKQYIRGTRDVLPIYNQIKKSVDIRRIMDFVKKDEDKYKTASPFQYNKMTNYFPTNRLALPVNKERILKTNTVKSNIESLIVDTMKWEIGDSYVLKNRLMIIDLLANNDWERPIYYAITVSSDNYMNLQPYFQLEGLTYRIVPIKGAFNRGEIGRIDTDIMFDNVMNKFKWGGIENENIFLDDNTLKMFSNYRSTFARLAEELLNEGKKDSCIQVINKCLELMPNNLVPYNYFIMPLIDVMYKAGMTDKATEISIDFTKMKQEEIDFYLSLDKDKLNTIDYEVRLSFHIIQEMLRFAKNNQLPDIPNELESYLQEKIMKYSNIVGI